MKYLTVFMSCVLFSATLAQANTAKLNALDALDALDANEVGFTAGNTFTAVPISGDIRVSCQDGETQDSNSFRCRMTRLDRADTSYFRGPAGVAAARVLLSALHEDGTVKERDLRYKTDEGRSEAVNLWFGTIFHGPLLKRGHNQITYTMRDRQGATVETGEFTAQINSGAAERCRYRWYSSNSLSDCRDGNSLCRRYFFEENYCRRR